MIILGTICRRSLIHRVRNGLLLIFILLFCLMFHISDYGKSSQSVSPEENANISNEIILSMVPQAYRKFLLGWNKTNFHPHGSNVSAWKNVPWQQPESIPEIRNRIREYNNFQTVLNEDIYGPLQNDSLVIVIQVHNRLMYLRHTIISLAQTAGIENALLVFSHDYYDEEINFLVQSIDFCKVMQIFYPYSIQTHPNTFPGESPNDCPRDMNIKLAIESKCNNALYPDMFGHYREAKFTQTKHHWWWKANRVFNGLNITRHYTGLVVFFEEDHYVSQDFIHMLHLMDYARQFHCGKCRILSLGTYLKQVDYPNNAKKVDIMNWVSSKHNMGMAFNRTLWNDMRSCAQTFCTYDDYNWDWSLSAVSTKCMSHELTAMVLRAPRVFHIGECGVHHKKSCNSTAALRKVQKLLAHSVKYMYPQDLTLLFYTAKKVPYKKNKGNGGWGDIRDHNLCLRMANGSRVMKNTINVSYPIVGTTHIKTRLRTSIKNRN